MVVCWHHFSLCDAVSKVVCQEANSQVIIDIHKNRKGQAKEMRKDHGMCAGGDLYTSAGHIHLLVS